MCVAAARRAALWCRLPPPQIDFLVASTHPHYHQFAYGTAPGGASAQLKGDLIKSVKETEYRGLVVTSANATSSPPAAAAATDGTGAAAADNSEAVIEFSYQKSDRLDKRQKFFIDRQTRQWETTFEKSKFMKGKDGGWLFAESQRFEMAANDVSAQVQKIRADMAAKKAAGADTPPAAAPAPAAPAPSS